MKRDLDLCRQLLADMEGHGPACAVTALRPGLSGEAEEAVRYHVRLLIDSGLAKEVEHAAGGAPCVRVTNSGHEFLELAHSEARWREARWVVGQTTGGQSLDVIRQVLMRWATEAATAGERRRMAAYAPYAASPYRSYLHRFEPRYLFERETEPANAEGRDLAGLNEGHPSSYRYLERFDWRWPVDWRDSASRDAYYRSPRYSDPLFREWRPVDIDGVTLPKHVV